MINGFIGWIIIFMIQPIENPQIIQSTFLRRSFQLRF